MSAAVKWAPTISEILAARGQVCCKCLGKGSYVVHRKVPDHTMSYRFACGYRTMTEDHGCECLWMSDLAAAIKAGLVVVAPEVGALVGAGAGVGL